MPRICSRGGRNSPHEARGLCVRHYDELRADGPLPPISFEDRLWAKVNRQAPGGCWLWTASTDGKGYGQIWSGGRLRPAHRVVWELIVGPIPDAMELDHVNHCSKACVNPAHLRPVTHAANGRNRKGANRNNRSTGVLGVIRRPSGKFEARAGTQYLGRYTSIGEAASAARAARERHAVTHILTRQEAN